MSELHKNFLKRIKEKELELGLSSLSEDSSDSDRSSPVATTEDDIILDKYKTFKDTYFNLKDIYQDQERELSFQTYYRAATSNNNTVLFCIHGAGSSSMTFAALAQHITESNQDIGILLYDMRGHGNSSQVTDFSLDNLVEDTQFILNKFCKLHPESSIYLLGHSLGGAVVAKLVSVSQYHQVKGIILLDIVEETAVKSLTVMPQFIERLPKQFLSINQAIDWHMKFLLHNKQSAELSVPDLLTRELTWKTDLQLTTNYWNTWFEGLSDNFINFKGGKLLILSEHETLDKKLMIGQMQGKYQLVVFNNNNVVAGHFIHEDLPKHTSICIIDFINRSINPQKLNQQIPKWGGTIHN